ncbi:Protein of unknown function, partial [Gryllus bimaculatus]
EEDEEPLGDEAWDDDQDHTPGDDEDYQNDIVSGSGSPPSSPDPNQPRYFRMTLHLHEPFTEALRSRNSHEYELLASQLRQGLEQL